MAWALMCRMEPGVLDLQSLVSVQPSFLFDQLLYDLPNGSSEWRVLERNVANQHELLKKPAPLSFFTRGNV